LTFHLDVTSHSKVKSVKSPSHPVEAEVGKTEDEHGQFGAKVKFSGKTADMDRDLVVLLETDDPHKPAVFVERSGDDPLVAAMVSLVPSFKLKDQPVELVTML
jgi:hypothetical protein